MQKPIGDAVITVPSSDEDDANYVDKVGYHSIFILFHFKCFTVYYSKEEKSTSKKVGSYGKSRTEHLLNLCKLIKLKIKQRYVALSGCIEP